MGHVRIVTDSTADIPKEKADELGITVVPLKVHIDGVTYEDGVDLSALSFYEKLPRTESIPTTSQPTPHQFEMIYRELAENDPDSEIISIHLSSQLSGTYQSAYIASQTVGEELSLTVVDSKRASYAIGVIVVEVAKLAKEGASKQACLDRINELLEETKVYFMVDTLKYLEKNGRIGRASALVGSLLKIKPILSLTTEGEVYPHDKVRGQQKALKRVFEQFEEHFGNDAVHVGISHANVEGYARELMEKMKQQFNVTDECITDIGPVIGAHVGPGTVAISVARTRS
ncbi:DegV family protein [Texcoconibacillus texcoconensis]|uniref:DegV family protein with EDD domain n=1 Tax=Texcoconibacillus texcoconensis TaxID=1095777 RepID=A0A840QL79_9BACI|nr:DegV family protein [Texcoconibacillus texcoconensis]MBB5172119.1 DegV family protein with EDD domain [Texcoconibacillus texcoconensis]